MDGGKCGGREKAEVHRKETVERDMQGRSPNPFHCSMNVSVEGPYIESIVLTESMKVVWITYKPFPPRPGIPGISQAVPLPPLHGQPDFACRQRKSRRGYFRGKAKINPE